METTKSKRYRDEDDEMDNERLLEILNSSIFKLSDFGLSKEMKNFNKKEVGGSPLYVDPMLFDQNVDRETIHNEKVDIWALGVLAYEIVRQRMA
jgi:serine/threonine protein kinase